MSIYVKSRVCSVGDLYLRCDGCGKTVLCCKDQTDRLLANDYIHENGWRTVKRGAKWIHACPDCKAAIEAKKREEFIEEFIEEKKERSNYD